ncbi:glycosyltransferase family 2 protein, partial [Candidatus Berkelbacteria bacterium]|nr:glycosyltransferase family 2 protein [Candidatus Berkelbacteria bacterium]
MTIVARPKISVAMIGSNSERYLDEVLRSVAWADETVLVLDPASQDRTRPIARAHGVRVIERAWTGFAAQKNAAIAATRHPWVLSLDCDEVVDAELQAAIARAEFERFDAFAVARKNHLGKQWVRHSGFYPDRQIRLFRRELRFDDRPVHEQLEVTGRRVGTLAGHLIHFTYADVAEYVRKVRRYATLDAELLSREGRRWSW